LDKVTLHNIQKIPVFFEKYRPIKQKIKNVLFFFEIGTKNACPTSDRKQFFD